MIDSKEHTSVEINLLVVVQAGRQLQCIPAGTAPLLRPHLHVGPPVACHQQASCGYCKQNTNDIMQVLLLL